MTTRRNGGMTGWGESCGPETLICSSYDPLMDRNSSVRAHTDALRLVGLAVTLQSKHALVWIYVLKNDKERKKEDVPPLSSSINTS